MSATKKDFQELAYELASCRPIPTTSGDVLGIVYPEHAYELARHQWSVTVDHIIAACQRMNPRFNADTFRLATLASVKSTTLHGR